MLISVRCCTIIPACICLLFRQYFTCFHNMCSYILICKFVILSNVLCFVHDFFIGLFSTYVMFYVCAAATSYKKFSMGGYQLSTMKGTL